MTTTTTDQIVALAAIARSLTGADAHVDAARVLEDLDWRLAGERPEGAPHSIFQLVHHIVYWQEWAAAWLDGTKPKPPERAALSWPGTQGPTSRREWERTTRRLERARRALESRAHKADLWSRHGRWSAVELLLVIGSHTSYHVGQITLLRQALGAWPPPSGGLTW